MFYKIIFAQVTSSAMTSFEKIQVGRTVYYSTVFFYFILFFRHIFFYAAENLGSGFKGIYLGWWRLDRR